MRLGKPTLIRNLSQMYIILRNMKTIVDRITVELIGVIYGW